MAEEYNGHPSWQHWNVCLWLHNEEPLYRMMLGVIRGAETREVAARRLLEILPSRTPDGADYSYETIHYAIEDEWAEMGLGSN